MLCAVPPLFLDEMRAATGRRSTAGADARVRPVASLRCKPTLLTFA
jgi:hypothetical protein